MNNDGQCIHKWRKNGLWDGKTVDGKRTGGVMYKCDLCQLTVNTEDKALEMGGTIIEGTNIYGKPVTNQ